MEAVSHQAVQQGIGDRGDRHALVVGHESAHNGNAISVRDPGSREVQRLVETVTAAGAEGLEPLEVPRGGLRVDHARQGGGVGSDHGIVRQPPLQAETWNAEVRVLVGELQILRVVSGLRHAPRRPHRRSILDLTADNQPIGLLDQALGRRPHDDGGHQVLEHRARPRDQCCAICYRCHRTAQPEPMP
ncbi:hypothetical protein GALL_525600 [mine drainage metagenome]|uniref:Uncharacterized protein n=1 Tax=mine drainage metagenome TaxID=410659 RepID=A0A1J5PQL6_9ZZZZ